MTTDALRGLLPCPFCGDGAVLNSDNQVECALCCAIGPLGGGKDAQANIANWNRRAPASAQTSSDGEAGSSVKRTGYNPNPTPSRSEQGLATPDTTGTASAMVQGEVALVGNVAKPEDSTESKPCADHLPRPSDPTPAVAREALAEYKNAWSRLIYDATGDMTKVVRAIELAELNGLFDPALAALSNPETETPEDDLEVLIAGFSKALLAKLKLARVNGRSGWDHDDWEAACQAGLLRHIEKGDPRDVAAYCAFMWHHGWVTKVAPSPPSAEPTAYMVLNKNGSTRLWSRDEDVAKVFAETRDLTLVPLYSPPPVTPERERVAEPSQETIRTVARAICKSRTCLGFSCCQWPAQTGERHKCPVEKGNYDDAAKDAIRALAQPAASSPQSAGQR